MLHNRVLRFLLMSLHISGRLLSRFVKKASELVQTHTAMPIFIETMVKPLQRSFGSRF